MANWRSARFWRPSWAIRSRPGNGKAIPRRVSNKVVSMRKRLISMSKAEAIGNDDTLGRNTLVDSDEPYALASPVERERRVAMADLPHIKPLKDFLTQIRGQR